ncbi:ferredoxin [Georgenia ruanii]|uniref:Ferredoxin n=1 Tax=Georgenia ruanii TaxID=348442 RepID=A0A7J9UUZ7_9MICO|nr:ferredoxin [Georgenia ruanii]MPV88451.1 ferredoxin [Georgenia ruanii]
MKRINIDMGKCSGHGRCYTLAPHLFEPDDEGFPVVRNAVVADDMDGISALAAAVDNCPERALTVTDEA